jgi:hypothetical protein
MLRIIADKPDELPEALRTVAKQEGDKYVVAELPEGVAIEDVAALKRTLVEVRHERDQLKGTVKAFEGIDPKSASEAREALEKLRAGQLKGSKEIDEYKATVEQKFAAERAALDAKLQARTSALRERMVKGELAPVVAKLGGSDAMDAIITLASQHIRVEEAEDGSLKHSIVDASGKPRVTKKGGSADPMGFEELIGEMRDASATRGLFKVSATGGAGGSSQNGGAGRVADPGQNMSPRELLDRANAG